MWMEIICGLVLYQLVKWFFSDDDNMEVESSDSNAILAVANRLEKIYGGKAYAGLRIPDADSGSRQSIDIVLVTKREAVVISVKNISGFVLIEANGSWLSEAHGHKSEQRHPDPIAETKRRAAVLEAYLEQRGLTLPEGYVSTKVVLPNPKFRTIYTNFPPEVITYEQWIELKPELKGMFTGWVKGAFRSGKKEMQESIDQQLNFILSTAPTWDRLEFKGNKYVLGEFIEFKGKTEDVQALRDIRRSKIGHVVIQKTSMLGFANTKLQVLYTPRDYRSEGSSALDWKEVTVRSHTEVLFQPQDSSKVRKYQLHNLSGIMLSA